MDETDLPRLLQAFYARVRKDDVLGPLFNEVVGDWDEHLQRLGEFWSSVMFATGRYKGNPIAMHLLHAHRLTPGMFDRWLRLWAATTNEMMPPLVAIGMQAKAARIAGNIKSAIDADLSHRLAAPR